ncbi:putative Tyrosine phosphatase family-domain-containing protein [Seiridium unicorne]|uniref:diphosphoinositol-polyphosphate diphosphatase n=1 Tax=Seiridium unicorne TaxID=138068 RepID=A0ABR2VAT4_9PEZI
MASLQNASAYSLLQLEAGLSTSSLATASTSDSSSNDQADMPEREFMLETGTQPAQESVMTPERPLSTALATVQPQNFSLVIPGVYRSSYPQAQDFTYLQGLKLKTIVTLVSKEIPEGYQVFLDGNGIQHLTFDMAGTKKADIPLTMMRSIIGLIADEENHPMLIHCNQGKHRTGCVVGVLRRYHGWDTASALDEYERFAHPKIRPTDVHYLRNFQLANLGHVVARRLDHPKPTLSVGHFVCLYVVIVLGVLFWILATYGVISFPLFDAPRPPRASEI